MRKRFTASKEAKRRSRERFGQVRITSRIPDKRRKPERHKKNLKITLEQN